MKSKERQKNILKHIQDYCLDCSSGELLERKNCPVDYCPLHPFRMGKNDTCATDLLRAIRVHCLHCAGDSASNVRKCPKDNCYLFNLRMG